MVYFYELMSLGLLGVSFRRPCFPPSPSSVWVADRVVFVLMWNDHRRGLSGLLRICIIICNVSRNVVTVSEQEDTGDGPGG